MSKLAQILILAVGLGSLANAATWGTCFPLPGCVATSRAHPPHDITWIGPKQTSISGECASFRRVGAPLKDVTSICQSATCSGLCQEVDEGRCVDARNGGSFRCLADISKSLADSAMEEEAVEV